MQGFLRAGGRPRLCVPLCGENMDEVLREIAFARGAGADMVEWRYDLYRAPLTPGAAAFCETLAAIKQAAGLPLLLTCRSRAEGGQGLWYSSGERFAPEMDPEAAGLLERCLARPDAAPDYFDVELGFGEAACARAFAAAARLGCGIVLSSHDFDTTPPDDQLYARLKAMRELAARHPGVQTVPKLAVMPESFDDVLRLMGLVHRFVQRDGGPVIAMSMGRLGRISRLCGAEFGSCLTFGAGLGQSAPGQMDAARLKAILNALDG